MVRWIVCAVALVVTGANGQVASGSVSGTVVDATNLGLPGTLVTIESPMPMAGILSDARGRFVIDGIPPGIYTLRIQASGFLPKELEVEIEDAKDISVGRVALDFGPVPPCLGSPNKPRISETKLRVDGRPGVSGSARGERGGAIEDVIVRLLPEGSNVIAATRSDQRGEFMIADVNPGVYYLEFSVGGSEFTRVPGIRVRKGHALEVHLTWQPWPPGHICL